MTAWRATSGIMARRLYSRKGAVAEMTSPQAADTFRVPDYSPLVRRFETVSGPGHTRLLTSRVLFAKDFESSERLLSGCESNHAVAFPLACPVVLVAP
jgi:hypothetical protein